MGAQGQAVAIAFAQDGSAKEAPELGRSASAQAAPKTSGEPIQTKPGRVTRETVLASRDERNPDVSAALERAASIPLSMPSASFARRALADQSWEGRIVVERMTPHVARSVLVYDFATLAGYLMGNSAITKSKVSKAAIDSPAFAVTRVDVRKLVSWVRDWMGDRELAGALEQLVDPAWCLRDQMSVVRVLVGRRYAQLRSAVDGESPSSCER